MNERKIKILGIAPYEGMKTAMQKLAAGRKDLELDVYVGDLNKGVDIAKQTFNSTYDVIISRGGTAELIGRATTIPVIEITLSVYDILRAIKLAENYSDRYAIVGFPAITDSARILCSLLKYELDIITIHEGDDVQELLKGLKRKGYRMVVCDMIANTTAKRLGLNAILITSGAESIETAFDLAVKLSRSYAAIKEENHFLNTVLQNSNMKTAVFDQNGRLYYSNLEQYGIDSAKLARSLKKELSQARLMEDRKIFKTIGGASFSITGRQLPAMSSQYTAFYLEESFLPSPACRRGITVSGRSEEEEKLFGSFYGITGIGEELNLTIGQMSQSSQPVFILGEEGTGKEQVVRELYTRSPLSGHPFITIDFAVCDGKTWEYLLTHHNSPFMDNKNTLVLSNLQSLTPEKHRALLAAVRDTSLCRRNRLFLTCICEPDAAMPPWGYEYVKALSAFTLYLPPLRSRREEIPDMASLYLGSLNVELAKQITGFEDGALDLLKSYSWPSNYSQFKRLLKELAALTSQPYIQVSDVRSLLSREQSLSPASAAWGTDWTAEINSGKTLDQITQEIISQVLKDTGGNQSAAAKRLGISRTTMWRMLKNE